MGPQVDVDSVAFEAASTIFGHDMGGELGAIYNGLGTDLGDTGAMAGADEGGRKWAARYDKVAPLTGELILDLANACRMIAMLLERTGFNHGFAESQSDPSRVVPAPADHTDYHPYVELIAESVAPPSEGGSGDAPTGWGLIKGLVGYEWPDGHQDKLHRAAAGWRKAAAGLGDTAGRVGEALIRIIEQTSPEVEDALRVCSSMRDHLTDTASVCRALAQGCDDLAIHLDSVHHQATTALKWLVGLSAATQVVGGIAAVVSGGAAEVPTQGAETAEIEATASEVGAYIATFVTEAGEVSLLVARTDSELLAVGGRLEPILGAQLSTATTEAVAGLPALAGAERLAGVRLVKAASPIWSQLQFPRGLAVEARLGANLPRSYPVIDEFDRGVATSIKSVDLTLDSYQNPARLTSRVRGYIDKVAGFNGASFNGKVIRARDITGRQLRVGIQSGAASTGQQAALDQLKAYARSRNVTLVISEVP